MYAILSRYLPPRLAAVACVAVFLSMLAAVVYFAFEPQADFRYLAL